MASANEEGKPSININEDDVKRAQNLGSIKLETRRGSKIRDAEHLAPSTLYSESLIRFNQLQSLREELETEILHELKDLRDRCESYGIDFEEVVDKV